MDCSSSGPTALADRAELVLFPGNRPGKVLFRHPRPAANAQVPGPLVELPLRMAEHVDAAERLAGPVPGCPSAAGRLRIRRALVVLRLPMVADLLERVLQCGEGRSMGALALAVRLDGAVVGPGVG